MPGLDLTIHHDIAQAETLPARFYSDPDIFEAVRERIFARSWQLVGDLDSIKAPGQTQPFTLLEGCLNEPLVLTRDFDDRMHCLSNVCTHRGTIVCEGPGMERHLRCRYHGRRFGLDGCFQHMPEFEQAKDFPTEKDNLRQFPLERWGKFLFTSLNPAVSFHEWIEPLRLGERFEWIPLDACVFDAARSREYLVQANWALYCDNYLEGFHIPYVHASLSEALDYGSYRTELFPWGNLQVGVAKDADDAFELPRGSAAADAGERIAAYYFWLFPNLMFNVYPWGISVNVVKPLAVDRTRVSFLTYVWDREKLVAGGGAGAWGGLDRVEREDEAIVEAVQRGVRSRFYDRGRYSPTREQGVHHFHRLLAQALGSG